MGEGDSGIDPAFLQQLAIEIAALVVAGVQIGLVVGGGNLFRGKALSEAGLDRVTGDYMGMLATAMNALALQDALKQQALDARVMSAWPLGPIGEVFQRDQAIRHLQQGRVVIFAAGTGNPFFTTDTAASLRAIEIQADLLLKATKVDGIYSSDPLKNPDARRYTRLSYQQALAEQLQVMDATAMILCAEQGLPLRVFDIKQMHALGLLLQGQEMGTLVDVEVNHD